MNVPKEIFNTLPADHYFINDSDYFDSFKNVFEVMYSKLSAKDQYDIAKSKYFIGSDELIFSSSQFVQFACELTVGYHFKAKQIELESEVKLNNTEKDVDWQIKHDGFCFNLEVKCSDENEFDAQPLTGKRKALQLIFAGRIPGPEKAKQGMKKIAAQLNYDLLTPKHADNRIKDYLIDANSKFEIDPGVKTLNILVVACGHFNNMSQWHTYLYGSQGLFTSGSFSDRSAYKNVDCVLLTSLRYNHQHKFARRSESWDLFRSFNLLFCNPYGRNNVTSEAIEIFLKITPNHTKEYHAFEPIASSDVPKEVSSVVKIIHFCSVALSKEQRNEYWPNSPYKEHDETKT